MKLTKLSALLTGHLYPSGGWVNPYTVVLQEVLCQWNPTSWPHRTPHRSGW